MAGPIGPVDSSFASAADEEISAKERELQDLRSEILRSRERADALAHDEKQQLARLHELEKEAALTSDLLLRLAEKEETLQVQIDSLQQKMAIGEARVHARRDQLAARLRAIYMRPRHDLLASALTSRSLTELSTRMRAMTHIARAERSVIEEVQRAQSDLRAQRGEVQRQVAEIHLTRSETEDRKMSLARLKEERRSALTELRQERAQFEASVDEMERAARAMEELIAELEKRRRERSQPVPSTDFPHFKGHLPWPVQGPVLKPYGRSVHPEFKTVVMNKGVNIGAPQGTPIRCVGPGIVEYVNWLPGYGKCIIVNHGDGFYTLYAHASAIFPREGAKVAQDEVIAEVGDTGSLNGSQLYFEIRKGHESLDPSQWLDH